MMSDIYANAYLTVVAASCGSPRQSFLSRRSPTNLFKVPYMSGSESNINGFYYIETCKLPEMPPPYALAWDCVNGTIWKTRGWTMQEEQFSRRVLYFGEDGFRFHCQEYHRVEKEVMPLSRYGVSWF